MTREVFVGPVRSSTQGVRLAEAGATYIGVRVSPDSEASTALYLRLGAEIGHSNVGAILDAQAEHAVHQLPTRPAFVEMDIRGHSQDAIESACSSLDVPIRLGGLSLDYDEDPRWLSDRLERLPVIDGLSYVITVLPGLRRPFAWLRHESGGHAEDVGLHDFLALCKVKSISLAADWGCRAEVRWFLDSLPTEASLSIYLGDPRPDIAPCPPTVSDRDSLSLLSLLLEERS